MKRTCLLALLLAAPVLTHAWADDLAVTPPPLMDTGSPPQPALDSTIIAIMQKMNEALGSVPLAGEPDHDFAITLIPHDDGAIGLAQFELEHGKDPQLRALATRIVAERKRQTAELTAWLKAHPVK